MFILSGLGLGHPTPYLLYIPGRRQSTNLIKLRRLDTLIKFLGKFKLPRNNRMDLNIGPLRGAAVGGNGQKYL